MLNVFISFWLSFFYMTIKLQCRFSIYAGLSGVAYGKSIEREALIVPNFVHECVSWCKDQDYSSLLFRLYTILILLKIILAKYYRSCHCVFL